MNERLRLTCIVDNRVGYGPLWGEHGLALLIEAGGRRLLLDTGQSGQVLLHNLAALRVSPESLDAVVLSHGHDDHGGGLAALGPSLPPGTPLHHHPDAFRPRFGGSERRAIGVGGAAELALWYDSRPSSEPVAVAPGVWTSGEVRERPRFEGRGAHHFVQTDAGLVPDPYRDDLSLFLTTGEGTVVVCGCAHAGVLNVLDQARRQLAAPIVAVIGGLHLGGATPARVAEVGDYLEGIGSPRLLLCHCTGERATRLLWRRFPEQVEPFAAGVRVEFPLGSPV